MTFDEYLEEQLKDEELKREYKKLQMKQVKVVCPKCGQTIHFKNWFHWVWHCPFHWFGKRRTKCIYCGKKSYMKKEK